MRYSDLPIQKKLFGTVLLAVSVTAVLMALSIGLYETMTFRPRFVAEARNNARMMAELLVPALEFDDERTAAIQLAALARGRAAVSSAIYRKDRALFVSNGNVADQFFGGQENKASWRWISNDRVVVIEPIEGPLGLLGWLRIELQLTGTLRRLQDYGVFALASLISLSALALMLSFVLRRAVSGPVMGLMDAAQAVSEKKDYSLRVPVAGGDEFGRLAAAFNDMLATLGTIDVERHRREAMLARHNRGLVELAQMEAKATEDAGSQIDVFLRILCRVHQIRRASFWSLEQGGTRLKCVIGYDSELNRSFSGSLLDEAEVPLYFAALRTQPVIVVPDIKKALVDENLRSRYCEPLNVGSILDVPVWRDGILVGVICDEHVGGPREWDTQEINFSAAVSDRVILIYERERLRAAQKALGDSEARYREMVEAAPDAIFTLDSRGFIGEPNKALEQITGWHPEHWRDVTFADAVRIEDRQLAEQVRLSVAQGGAAKVVTLYIRKADGGTVALECFLAQRQRTLGMGSVLCVGRDQTQRLAASAEQTRLEELLRKSQKLEAVGKLAGGIAHDFNNILVALTGNLRFIGDELSIGHPALPYLEKTLLATQRARDLVRQILTFGRGHESLRKPVSIEEVVREAYGLLRASLPASISIQLRFAPKTPNVLADASQLHQVIMNLATNAFHAMEAQGGVLTIEVEPGEVKESDRAIYPQLKVGRHIILSVSDNGCGMDEKVQMHLFEPFFTTKAQGRGTGLGMAVVHGILESHESTITVQSAPGKGTTLRLYFPVHELSLALPETVVLPIPNPPTIQGQRLLLVDDESMVIQIFEMLLKRKGYRPDAFSDPREALVAFESAPDEYALILTDLTMPHLSGLDFAQKIRAIRPKIPIIIMTGYGGDHTSSFAIAGISETLLKPFSAEDLIAAVERGLSGSA